MTRMRKAILITSVIVGLALVMGLGFVAGGQANPALDRFFRIMTAVDSLLLVVFMSWLLWRRRRSAR